ncbi:MAG TPA: RagB/SusD family nutrient uptake outer membrane protein [Parapedobacter sp.]|uniref:RagB/SusD family nutrient uptake outer membrane protein n=1 Tax=Parapedobacter sp. TaxID=1958893 RepID=UPI002CFE5375|nr:RagB/SusD family nutrient uptake outer membrane protein [Parapedobacter sp.]HWK57157.1 RagB/SusD family nutrient uptake outer membrane protein [Parapedobacter sp.]
MKNILIIFLWLLAFAIVGCEKFKVGNDFLEKPPSVDVTKDTIFSNLEYANRFLTGAYATLHYGLLYDFSAKGIGMDADILESLTDITQSFRLDGAVYRIYYSGQYSAGTENNATGTKYSFLHEDSWKGIRMAYIFLENIDRVPNVNEQTKKRLKAEAKMIIAMHYADMYRHFGGLPWIDHAIGVNEDTHFPRLTSLATMDSIINIIDEATPDLPWVLNDINNDDGRFTQASALGLKARMLLFGASPLFNSDTPYLDGEASQQKMTWHGNYDQNLWKRAANAAEELIQKVEAQGGYELVKTGHPRQDFQKAYYQRGNGEILISTRVRYRNEGDYDYLGMQVTRIHGIGCPTQEYVNMFGMANGLPISDPNSGYVEENPFVNRDPRLYETVLTNEDTYQGRTAQLWVGGIERQSIGQSMAATGYDMRKFLLDFNSATSFGSVVQFPYLRLAEIYLTYAEASNQLNNGPTPEAYRCVNVVRNRVGLPDLTPNLNKEQFHEAVLIERACEFGYEEVRWFDLIRWKRADDFTKKLHGMNIFKEGDEFTYQLFELPTRAWQRSWSPKWYLSAFPPTEVNKGYGLVQNPGW